MKAQTLDEVLAQLEIVIDKSVADKDRLGFFAVLYHTVTSRVKEGILNNEFDDNTRMENLDVTFANRYLDALEKHNDSKETTASWAVAFKSAKKSSLLVLHHLLLGMNAHINLDLGISAVDVMKSGELKKIQKDFNQINAILSELTAELINKINRISPLLSLLGLHATNNNSVFIQFAISNARDGAWVFAEELSEKTGDAIQTYIIERDEKIKRLAEGITQASFFLKLSIWFIHLFEWKNPAKIMTVLRQYKKSYFKVTESAIKVGTKTGSSVEIQPS
ncbi:MAG: DUF5995 family protein [Chitinophagaceae bacterium]